MLILIIDRNIRMIDAHIINWTIEMSVPRTIVRSTQTLFDSVLLMSSTT